MSEYEEAALALARQAADARERLRRTRLLIEEAAVRDPELTAKIHGLSAAILAGREDGYRENYSPARAARFDAISVLAFGAMTAHDDVVATLGTAQYGEPAWRDWSALRALTTARDAFLAGHSIGWGAGFYVGKESPRDQR